MNDKAGFCADWLRQREPFDRAARSVRLGDGFKAALTRQRYPHRPRSGQPPRAATALRLIDLAAGSGANFRALAPTLAIDQDWLLIDHDPLLLAAQRTEIAHWAAHHGWHAKDDGHALHIDAGTARWTVRGQALDLARDLERIDLAACDGLVTTAFLDLVSAGWLDRLCALLADTPRALLATLSVDGRRTWRPPHPVDAVIDHAFLADQGGDKGFGPSLGVGAVAHLAQGLAGQGWQVATAPSDWSIGPGHQRMLRTLAKEAAMVAMSMEGSARFDASDCAAEPMQGLQAAASQWLAERLAGIARDEVSLTVGHLDLLAVPD